MRISGCILLGALTLGMIPVRTQTEGAPPSSVVRAGRLLDVRAGVYRSDQGIWIEGGRIRQIADFATVRAAAPKNATLIDLGRLTILPGLIDCHAHLLAAIGSRRQPVGQPHSHARHGVSGEARASWGRHGARDAGRRIHDRTQCRPFGCGRGRRPARCHSQQLDCRAENCRRGPQESRRRVDRRCRCRVPSPER